jgi:hypothetical protein
MKWLNKNQKQKNIGLCLYLDNKRPDFRNRSSILPRRRFTLQWHLYQKEAEMAGEKAQLD